MVFNETDLLLWPCIHSIRSISWNLPCILCRLGGAIILLISIVCFTLNIRFLYMQQRQNSLVISLYLASLLVITISVPGVVIQLFTCHRHCFIIYCRIEGFISYLSASLCMVAFVALSIHRYVVLCSYELCVSYRGSTCISWLLSVSFTSPLLFGYLNSYSPEGLGFHCSINWQDRSNISRLYLLLSFMFIYCIPLAILLFVNARARTIIQNACSQDYFISAFPNFTQQRYSMKKSRQTDDFQKNYVNDFCMKVATHRKCSRRNYHLFRANMFLVIIYLVAWTPYAIMALLQLFDIKFVFQYTFLITLSAFIGKISVIITPCTYSLIMSYKFFLNSLFK